MPAKLSASSLSLTVAMTLVAWSCFVQANERGKYGNSEIYHEQVMYGDYYHPEQKDYTGLYQNENAAMRPMDLPQQYPGEGQVPPPSAKQGGKDSQTHFMAHMRDLGKSSLNSARRSYQETKPALKAVVQDARQVMKRLKKNPKVNRVIEKAWPKLVKPFVERSAKKGEGVSSKAQEGSSANGWQQQRASYEDSPPKHPGSVYTVTPSGAQEMDGYWHQ